MSIVHEEIDNIYLHHIHKTTPISRKEVRSLWKDGVVSGVFNLQNEVLFDSCKDFCILEKNNTSESQVGKLENALRNAISNNVSLQNNYNLLECEYKNVQNQILEVQNKMNLLLKSIKDLSYFMSNHGSNPSNKNASEKLLEKLSEKEMKVNNLIQKEKQQKKRQNIQKEKQQQQQQQQQQKEKKQQRVAIKSQDKIFFTSENQGRLINKSLSITRENDKINCIISDGDDVSQKLKNNSNSSEKNNSSQDDGCANTIIISDSFFEIFRSLVLADFELESIKEKIVTNSKKDIEFHKKILLFMNKTEDMSEQVCILKKKIEDSSHQLEETSNDLKNRDQELGRLKVHSKVLQEKNLSLEQELEIKCKLNQEREKEIQKLETNANSLQEELQKKYDEFSSLSERYKEMQISHEDQIDHMNYAINSLQDQLSQISLQCSLLETKNLQFTQKTIEISQNDHINKRLLERYLVELEKIPDCESNN